MGASQHISPAVQISSQPRSITQGHDWSWQSSCLISPACVKTRSSGSFLFLFWTKFQCRGNQKNLPALIQTKSHYVEMTRVLIYLFKSTSFILGDLWLLIVYLKNKMSFMETAAFFSGQLCIFLPWNLPTGRNDNTFPSMPSSDIETKLGNGSFKAQMFFDFKATY